jgi:dipeptidyl aminopeptidase/acylaminoacyl peptidase
MSTFIKLTALILLPLVLLAGDKTALDFDLFFGLDRVGTPAVSPDGGRIAFTVKDMDIENNSSFTTIRVIDSAGKPVCAIHLDASVGNPVFASEDMLYYRMSGQIYKYDINSDMHEQVSDVYGGIGAFILSPDGKHILAQAEMYPDCDTPECGKAKDMQKSESPVKARVYDELMYRHWNEWRSEKRNHLLLLSRDGKFIRDLTPGKFDSPPIALDSGADYVFSPDGKYVAFASNRDPMVAISTNNDIFVVSVAGGAEQKISSSAGVDIAPQYSPDGNYLAWLTMERAGFEADRKRILVKDLKSGAVTELTHGFTNTVNQFVWSPDGKSIYFVAQEKGKLPVYKAELGGNTVPVLKGHYLKGLHVSGRDKLIFARQSAQGPDEIWCYDMKNEKLKQLSHVNDEALAGLELPGYEEFWFTGAMGEKVQGFIMKPPFYEEGKKYPAIELIHGGPQGMWSDNFHWRWNYQMFASKGYVVFWINFHGSTGYGQPFTDAISGHWGDYPYEDIVKGTEYVLSNYDYIDRERVGAAGASYGGFMINWILGHENPFKCLVSHDGVYEQISMYGATEELWFPEWEFGGTPWQEGTTFDKWSPARNAANFKTPTLVIHGEQDFRVPYTQGLQLFTALQRQGVPSKLLFFPDEDHFVQKPLNAKLWWSTVDDWFAKYLK